MVSSVSNLTLGSLQRYSEQKNKFCDPFTTVDGKDRATVTLKGLDTLWFNTGTICNLQCRNCYIESSPSNDRLVYLEAADVAAFLDELDRDWQTSEIGFTGGEPFMNPEIIDMLSDSLDRGYRVLLLTNSMRPMLKLSDSLIVIKKKYGKMFSLRVSLDHYTPELHELERGANTWDVVIKGLHWLKSHSFNVFIAGRTVWNETETELREGYSKLFKCEGFDVDAFDKKKLVLFPEMIEDKDIPEISSACWDILNVSPNSLMCANSRMVVRKKGSLHANIQACTLLPYDCQFDLGNSLADSKKLVRLNHQYCAQFCVLGGGTCSLK